MRRVLGGVAAAVLALTAVPALATQDEAPAEPAPTPVLAPCAPRAGATVLTVDGFEGTVDTPAPPFGETTRALVLDLAGLPVGTTAAVDTLMTWGIPVNDFDLNVNGTDSQNVQPVDPAEESVLVSGVRHCSTVTLTAVNFTAPVVVDTLEVAVKVAPRLPK